jgi:hypothetical protein
MLATDRQKRSFAQESSNEEALSPRESVLIGNYFCNLRLLRLEPPGPDDSLESITAGKRGDFDSGAMLTFLTLIRCTASSEKFLSDLVGR